MTLIAGSYEKFIWGFSLSSSNDGTLTLKRLFTYPSHLSPITSVAASSPLAASSSSGDSSVHLYHLPSASSLGSTPVPQASTCLSFYSSSRLISGSSDGSVSIFDTEPFVLLKSIPMSKGKKSGGSGGLGVNDVAVHGSGRLALAVGGGKKKVDGWLGMVNLVRGRRSYVGGGLGGEGRLVGWVGEGGFYVVVGEGKLGWHAAEDARRVWEVECDKRVLCAEPASQVWFVSVLPLL